MKTEQEINERLQEAEERFKEYTTKASAERIKDGYMGDHGNHSSSYQGIADMALLEARILRWVLRDEKPLG